MLRAFRRLRSGPVFRTWLATRKHLPASVFYEGAEEVTFLVSYPKSGNTWLRFIIANLISGDEPVTFENIDRLLPDVGRVTTRSIGSLPKPRIIKSHSAFNPSYDKIVYVVRDPRDVFISEFHYHKKYGRLPASASLEDFLEIFLAGTLTPKGYGTWASHVGSWLALEESPNAFWVRYEDLYEPDAVSIVSKLASFLELQIDEDTALRALTDSSADKMKELESKSNWKSEKGLVDNKSVPFVREAKTGQWKKVLSPETSARIEKEWGLWMKKLGYLD